MAVTQTLSVTEVAGSANYTANTSKVRILWQSTQTGDSWNGYTRTAKYFISVNGGAEIAYSVNYTLPQSSTTTIVDTTVTVAHKSDGSGTVKVRTWMDTSISAGVVEKSKTITLAIIPRASTIDSLTCATKYFNGVITYKYTPKTSNYYNRCDISLNVNGSYIAVKSINLGAQAASQRVATVTFTESDLSTIYNKFPSTTKGTLRFTLRTFSDSGYSIQVGNEGYKEITLDIPSDSSTKPSLSFSLTPSHSLTGDFASLYVQGHSKVKATITASGNYGATIVQRKMVVEGKTYDSSHSFTSGYLTGHGTIAVTAIAIDSRGYSQSETKNITVIAYTKPRVIPALGESFIVCERCDSAGNLSESGTHLKIKAKRSYSLCESGGVQKNFCGLRYRYKTGADSAYSAWVTLLDGKTLTTDEVNTIQMNGALAATASYIVQVDAVDSIGYHTYSTFEIPTDEVYWHRSGSKKALGLGKYAEHPNAVDSAWDFYMNNHTITGLPTPTSDSDAVPKSYVDAADIKIINKNLNATGWYKLGTLSGGTCAVATLTIGGGFSYNEASPSMVDIATQYNQGRVLLRLPTLIDSQISKVGLIREAPKVYGVYVHYNTTNENPVSINVHLHMGAFVSADLEVSSVTDSNMISVVNLKQ